MGLKLVHTETREYYEDSYGQREYTQGSGAIYRVYQLDDGERHFRQNGYQPSYGDPVWNDDLEEVRPRTVSVVAYEYGDV